MYSNERPLNADPFYSRNSLLDVSRCYIKVSYKILVVF
jgi:hypothetical protein